MRTRFTLEQATRLAVTSIVALGGAIACAQTTPEATTAIDDDRPADAPNVVVTTSVLCDLTEQIAATTVNLTCLLPPGQDPHAYQPKPADRLVLDEADLVLYDGYNFAPAVIGLVQASNTSAPRVAVYEMAVPDPLMGRGHDHDHDQEHDQEHDHDHDAAAPHAETAEPAADDDHGHDHEHEDAAAESEALSASEPNAAVASVPDPHIWHNAENNAAIAAVIADELANINPEQADQYQQTAAQLTATFAALDDWVQTQVDTIPADNRYLVTTHDAFRYFADAYGLEVKGALSGLSTAEKSSAKVLTDLSNQVKAAQVPAIFAESTTNPELINAIAREADVQVAAQPLFVEGPGAADSIAPTVQAMLVANTCTIVNALGGSCDEAQAPLQ